MTSTSNLDEIDTLLQGVDQAFQHSDDAGRLRLSQFRYLIQAEFPSDPYSPAYAEAQRKLYTSLSGRSAYEPSVNEHTPFDIHQAAHAPFPYATHSPSTVGEQLIAQGFLIRSMNLRSGARIVEYGPGWGNLTIALAQMGYHVTAVEIEHNFVELIRQRADMLCATVDVVEQNMLDFEADTPYDAALFFESFHHCADHLGLLRKLETIVAPDGFIVFAAEPIETYPQPWGFVRTDGLTIWSIRRMGWYEQGFDSSYFLRTLLRLGWTPQRHTNAISLLADVIIARRSQRFYDPCDMTLPPDEDATWAAPEAGHRFTSAQSLFSCDASKDISAVEICLSNPAPFELVVNFAAGETLRQVAVPKHTERMIIHLETRGWNGQLRIASPTWIPALVFGTTDQRHLGVAVHWIRLFGQH